jgi:hypothetical protein
VGAKKGTAAPLPMAGCDHEHTMAGPTSSRREILVAEPERETDAGVEALDRLTGLATAHIVVLPDDPAVARADDEGLAPIDAAPDAPAVRALAELARRVGSG